MEVRCGEKGGLLSSRPQVDSARNRDMKSRNWIRVLATYGSSFLLALAVSHTIWGISETREVAALAKSCDDPVLGYQCRPEISQYWGQYSPYFSVPSQIPDRLPNDCEVSFVQILSRHGARDPTLDRTLGYAKTIIKIQATAEELTGKWAFLKKYRYNLGADQLNEFGRRELYNSGAKFYRRYRKLSKKVTPFVRASGQRRVVESADAWMEGYHQAKVADKAAGPDDEYPYDKVVINEGPEFNNTLDHSLCVNIETGPMSNIRSDAKDAWVNVYGPVILDRLQRELPNSQIKMKDMHNLMSMCPFDTIHSAKGRISPFCDLFTEEEWHQYNQLENLEKFYGWGRGNPLGPTQGIGFTNELIARMLHKPVEDNTSTNHTLDDNPKTFPLDKNQTMYADFSHDNDLTAAFFAMGLFNSTPMLSITQVDSIEFTKGWSSAWTVPFAARAYFEKMTCRSRGDEELVRIILNDRVLPMEACGGDNLGRCTLSNFVKSLSWARSGGNWHQCFEPRIQAEVELPSARLLREQYVKEVA